MADYPVLDAQGNVIVASATDPAWTLPDAFDLTGHYPVLDALGGVIVAEAYEGGGGGDGGEPPINALFQSANADGWSATYASPPVFDPYGSPEQFSVTRQGFDAAGQAAAVVDNLVVMKRLRQPYPAQASLTLDQVVLSDFIYAGDVISGATNNSTRAAPKPLAMWLNREREICTTDAHTVRMVVAHAHARAGRPVAAVKFTASDGTTTVESLVSAMSVQTYSASGLSVPHFAANLDFSGFANGAAITIDAVIYPWVGAAFTVSVDADAYPSPNLTTLRVLNNRTGAYGPAYAYVDPVSGNDGTGVTSAIPATAAASPYLTLAAAAVAVKTFNNSTYGRNFADGGVVRLVEGLHIHSTQFRTTAPTSVWPLTIEAADPSKRATTVLRDRGSSLSNCLPAQTVFRNVTLQRSGAGNFVFLDNSATNLDYANVMAFEDCAFDANGAGTYAGWVYKTGLGFFINCTQLSTCGQASRLSVVNKTVKSWGCAGEFVNYATAYASAGCHNTSASPTFAPQAATTGAPACVGGMVAFAHLTCTANAAKIVQIDGVIGPRGVAVVGCVLEQLQGDTGPAVAASADGVVNPVENLVFMANTVVGARMNWLYQDTGSTTITKSGYLRFNVINERNTKADIFGSNSNLVGNWPAVMNVGAVANTNLLGSNSGDLYALGDWVGEVKPLHEVTGTDASPILALWANDQSYYGGNAGNGDYTPGVGNGLAAIPAGLTPHSHDMKGRALVEGSALSGAVQAA